MQGANQNNNIDTMESKKVNFWQSDLDAAIRLNDDERMWEIIAAQKDQKAAHEALATLVPRLAYKIDGKNRYSEFLAVPVIDKPDGSVIGNSNLWATAVHTICEALDVWVPGGIYKTVFNDIRPYDWVGTWRPEVTRGHLTRILPGANGDKMTMLTQPIFLPKNAPRLGFICFVATSEKGWPALPAADTLRDQRFQKVVSYALADHNFENAPTILAPDRFQFAIPDGICLWLMDLNKTVGIKAWSASPIMITPDIVTVTLSLDSDEVPTTQFTVLKHQTGMQGLEDIMKTLQHLAPMADAPSDLPGAEKN